MEGIVWLLRSDGGEAVFAKTELMKAITKRVRVCMESIVGENLETE